MLNISCTFRTEYNSMTGTRKHTLETCQTHFIMCHNDPSVLSLELNKNICLSFRFLNHFLDSDEIQYVNSIMWCCDSHPIFPECLRIHHYSIIWGLEEKLKCHLVQILSERDIRMCFTLKFCYNYSSFSSVQ